jgi:uncharacterized membrane protein
MKQNEFFNILMDGLKDFPETKLQDIISYYENKFTIGLISGITEEDIISELGNPNLIVEKHRNENSNTNFTSELNTNINTNINTNDNDTNNNNNNNNDNNNEIINSNAGNTNSINGTNINISAIAEKLNEDQNKDVNNKHSNKNSPYSINNILRFCIVGLALLIFFPVITGLIGFIFGLFGLTLSVILGSIGLLVGGTFTNFVGVPNLPAFVANFPYPVIVLFSLGSISLSILLTLVFYYLCKLLIRLSKKSYNLLKTKGGAF